MHCPTASKIPRMQIAFKLPLERTTAYAHLTGGRPVQRRHLRLHRIPSPPLLRLVLCGSHNAEDLLGHLQCSSQCSSRQCSRLALWGATRHGRTRTQRRQAGTLDLELHPNRGPHLCRGLARPAGGHDRVVEAQQRRLRSQALRAPGVRHHLRHRQPPLGVCTCKVDRVGSAKGVMMAVGGVREEARHCPSALGVAKL